MKIFSLVAVLFAILYIAAGSPTDKPEGEEDAEGRGLFGNIVGKIAGVGVGAINKIESMVPGMGGKGGDDKVTGTPRAEGDDAAPAEAS